jgi:hypothetical protein
MTVPPVIRIEGFWLAGPVVGQNPTASLMHSDHRWAATALHWRAKAMKDGQKASLGW